jgi:hypothetical protein
MGERRLGRSLIFEPVIDLVRDQPKSVAPAGLGDLGKTRVECHGAGRIVGAGEQEARGSRAVTTTRSGRIATP